MHCELQEKDCRASPMPSISSIVHGKYLVFDKDLHPEAAVTVAVVVGSADDARRRDFVE